MLWCHLRSKFSRTNKEIARERDYVNNLEEEGLCKQFRGRGIM